MLSHIAIQLQDIQWHDACLKFYIGDFFHKLRILSKPEQICVCVSMCHQQDVFFSSFFFLYHSPYANSVRAWATP